MPPKRPPKSPAKQRTIASFFSPPAKRTAEVIEVSDSDDDVVLVEKRPRVENGRTEGKGKGKGKAGVAVEVAEEKQETDEELARRLAAEWEAEDRPSQEVKDEPEAKPSPNPQHGSPPKKLHPMFARAQEAGPSRPRETKPESSEPKVKEERKPTLTATRPQPVDPIDFDSDSLLFRPAAVDISRWPAGRLPYSVLVGVYVQVAGTRSRLTIVRVLTKCVAFSCHPPC
jgi:DNA ligase-1